MVKSTCTRCNTLFNQRERVVATMITFGQVSTLVLNKAMEDAWRKKNSHIVLEFNRCDTQFLVQETINPREVWPVGNFTVRLDEKWCDYGKFQKVNMPCSHVVVACKHVHHEYENYKYHVYTLESISNMYK